MDPGHLLTTVLRALEEQGHRVCVLRGHEWLPRDAPAEVSLLGTPAAQRALEEMLHQGRFYLVHGSRHAHSCSYTIADPSALAALRLDLTTRCYMAGTEWLDAAEVLSAARPHQPDGPEGASTARSHEVPFWVPAPRHEFALSVVRHVLEGRAVTESQGCRLSRLYRTDPEGCAAELSRVLPDRGVAVLRAAASGHRWDAFAGQVAALRRMLLRQATDRDPARILRQWADRRRECFRRLFQPAGLVVAFLGPDGVGKSTIIERVEQAAPRLFLSPRGFHLRPRLGRTRKATVTDPHGQNERGLMGSIVKLLLWWTDYNLSYVTIVYPALIRSSIVIFDRYYEDLLVDPKRYRYGGPAWLAHFGRWLVPGPHLFIVLDAPAETVHARKQEVSLAELIRQREGYRRMSARLANAHLVDAAQPVDASVREVMHIVLRWTSERCRRRMLPLPGAPSEVGSCPRGEGEIAR